MVHTEKIVPIRKQMGGGAGLARPQGGPVLQPSGFPLHNLPSATMVKA